VSLAVQSWRSVFLARARGAWYILFMRSRGGMFVPGGGVGVQDKREPCEACLQGQGEVSQDVNREVFSYRWRWNFCPRVKGEVHRGEASCEVLG